MTRTSQPQPDRRESPHFKAREQSTRTYLEPGKPGVVRLDGRAFHTYCKGLDKPFDEAFMTDMDAVMLKLCEQVDGVRLAYVQSDEISLLLEDHEVREDGLRVEQGFMFGGGVQKLVSIAAAVASVEMNARRLGTATDKIALFDARAFSLEDGAEAREYFAWRQDDARTNSLSMLASAHYSHRRIVGMNSLDRAALLRSDGIEPDELPDGFRQGRVAVHRMEPGTSTFFDPKTGTDQTVAFERRRRVVVTAPDFGRGLPTMR